MVEGPAVADTELAVLCDSSEVLVWVSAASLLEVTLESSKRELRRLETGSSKPVDVAAVASEVALSSL